MAFTGKAKDFPEMPLRVAATMLMFLQNPDDTPRDITGPEVVPGLEASSTPAWLWLIFPVVLFAIVLAVLFRRRAPRRRTAESQRALQRLGRLVNLQLLAKNQPERHFTLLAGILRRCVDKAFGVAATRQTTAEFLEAAALNPFLRNHLTFLTTFLTQCDIAKFAPPAACQGMGRDLEAQLRAWLLALDAGAKSQPSLDARPAASKMSDS